MATHIEHRFNLCLECNCRGNCSRGSVTPQLVSPPQLAPRTICGKLCCRRWPPGPSMAAMDGPLCRKWSPCSKLEKQWLQLQTDLYILTGEFEVTIKYLEIMPCMFFFLNGIHIRLKLSLKTTIDQKNHVFICDSPPNKIKKTQKDQVIKTHYNDLIG